jgi:hypothetical protein
MTRRGAWRHFVTRVRLASPARLAPLGDVALVYIARGASDLLGPRDAALLDRGEAVDLAPAGEVELFVVDFWRG